MGASHDREDDSQPIDLTSDRVGAIVAAEFPDLAPVRADYLGEGCDSVAFVVNGALVFRFPKRGDVAEQLLREVDLLPHVARRVALPIPVYSHVGRPSRLFPRPFGAYPLLAGTPASHLDAATLPWHEIACALAGTLSGLHAWEQADALARDIPSTEVADLIDEVRTDALDDFDLVAREAPDAPLEQWRAYLSRAPSALVERAEPVVVHGDLAAEHVLFDPATRTVTGIIDWSEIALADPALDFAAAFHWGGQALVDRVLRLYAGAATQGTLSRARYLAACRGVCDIRFGLDMQRPEYVRGGVRALELCIP